MVLAREIVENSTGSFQQNVNKSVKHLTTEALFVGQSKESPTRKCIFCNELHWNDECDKFVTIEARKDRIKGRCFTCFKQTHMKQGLHQHKEVLLL